MKRTYDIIISYLEWLIDLIGSLDGIDKKVRYEKMDMGARKLPKFYLW